MALTQVKTLGLADGTDGQILTYDSNGVVTAVGPGTNGQVLTSTGAGSPPAFETIGTFTGNIDIDSDTSKLRLGDGQDLEIYHDGGVARMYNSTGSIVMRSDSFFFQKGDGSEHMARFIHDGACELWHNDIKTLETQANGIIVQGPEGGDAYIFLKADEGDDNDDQWRFVASSSGNFHLQNASSGSWENSILANGDGNVELYHDNVKTFSTVSTGIVVQGPEGGNAEIYMYADEADDNADNWKIEADTSGSFNVRSYAGGSWQTELALDASGNLVATGNVTAYSDARLKTDIKTIDNALDKVTKLRGVSYKKLDTQAQEIGVIAQEVQNVVPEVVHDGAYQSVAYGNLVGLLIEAVKELKTELDAHKKKCPADGGE